MLKEPCYVPTLPFLLSSPPPPPFTRASCVTTVICMRVGEGQRVFMQKLVAGGREGGDKRRRRRWRTAYKELPLLPVHPYLILDTSLTAGEALNTKKKP